MKRSRITSYLGMVSLGLAVIPGILIFFLEPKYREPLILVPGLLFSALAIIPSIVCSYFELKASKHNWNFYSPTIRESVGKGLSLFYGLVFLLLGIIGPLVAIYSSSDSTFLVDFGFMYISWIISGILGIIGAVVYRDSAENPSSDEQIRKRKIGIIMIMICSILIVSSILFLNTIAPYYRWFNISQDAYVYEHYPDTNYGGEKEIYVGNYEYGKTEAYYQLDLSDFESNWIEAKLLVRFDYASYPVNVGASITFEPWDELTITWNNKPNSTDLYGQIVCDGFDFYVPLKPKHLIDNKITICLFGQGGGSDGYLLGTSKEYASSDEDIPIVYLECKGINPDFYIWYIIVYVGIIVVGLLYLRSAGRSKHLRLPPRVSIPFQRLPEHRFDNFLLRPPPRPRGDRVVPPIRRGLPQYPDFYTPKEIYKINELVDLRLIGNRTYIYVKNKRLMVCTFLLINIPKDRVQDYDEIRSIDEAAEFLDKSLEVTPPFAYKITPEEEFRAHCSNIQAFFESGLNTDILHTNIAFPLLKELVHQEFQPALKVFKEEIARRFNEGTFNSRRFLYLQGYLNYLSKEEKQLLEGYDDFIERLPYRTPYPEHFFMRERVLNDRQEHFREAFRRDMRLDKIIIFGDTGVGKQTFHQRYISSAFREDTRLTIGVNFGFKNLTVHNQPFRLQIWNFSGEERFRFLLPNYAIGAMGGIFIYDITNKASLVRLDYWLTTIRRSFRGGDIFPIIVVGNKSDLAQNREVSVEYALKYAKSREVKSYIECSFHTGKNVEKIFKRLVRIILHDRA